MTAAGAGNCLVRVGESQPGGCRERGHERQVIQQPAATVGRFAFELRHGADRQPAEGRELRPVRRFVGQYL